MFVKIDCLAQGTAGRLLVETSKQYRQPAMRQTFDPFAHGWLVLQMRCPALRPFAASSIVWTTYANPSARWFVVSNGCGRREVKTARRVRSAMCRPRAGRILVSRILRCPPRGGHGI